MNQDSDETAFEFVPKCLGDIIRLNRDQAELRLAKTAEIDSLLGNIDGSLNAKDEIDHWRLVSLFDKVNRTAQVMLIGDSQFWKRPAVTSPILLIDFAKGLACTKNQSVYKLGNRGVGEPPTEYVQCLCATLQRWGSGGLGVSPISF